MWKYILCFCLFIAMCFMMPCFFIDLDSINNKIKLDAEKNMSGDTLIDESGERIKLLLSDSNKIIELSMNDYIKGVVLRRNACNI